MKNLKLILPMMAIIFAIGLMFATSNIEADPNNDYVLTSEGVVTIQEIDCGLGDNQCRAQLEEGGPVYDVFDDPSLTMPKEGSGSITRLY
ncbi:DUF6520 family protein [Salegentibacter maritimus]|uniref:DUF6520 family protein n=1 Tax=Salegentibacter maritimus TaxID=2794347 RepID=UPI0018E477A4|nr:DUF6520 family protein [Salegentibacter maritimus]MBI6118259.1 hypothetical protein [Salegentibacter maritimus]